MERIATINDVVMEKMSIDDLSDSQESTAYMSQFQKSSSDRNRDALIESERKNGAGFSLTCLEIVE